MNTMEHLVQAASSMDKKQLSAFVKSMDPEQFSAWGAINFKGTEKERHQDLLDNHPRMCETVLQLDGVSERMRVSNALPTSERSNIPKAAAHVKETVALLLKVSGDVDCAMSVHVQPLISKCFRCIRDLLASEGSRRNMALKSGIIKAAPALAGRLKADLDLALSLSSIFFTLFTMHDPQVAKAAIEAGATRALVELVSAHADHDELAHCCWGPIVDILNIDHANAPDVVFASGGVLAAVRTMRAHPSQEKLQRSCVSTLMCFDATRTDENVLMVAGCSEAIMGALRAHSTVEDIVGGALSLVCASVPAGVHHDAIAAARNFPASAFVQAGACGVLSVVLSTNPAARKELNEARKVAPLLVSALRAHSANAFVASAVCSSLRWLKGSWPQLLKLRVIEGVVALFGMHKRNKLVLGPCCGAVMVIVTMFGGMPGLMGEGAAEKLVRVLRQNRDCAALQAGALDCLRKLVVNSVANRRRIMDLEVVEDVIRAFELHKDDTHLLGFGTGLLANLCVKSPENQRRMMQTGAVDVVVNLMLLKPFADGRFIQNGMMLITNIKHIALPAAAAQAVLGAMQGMPLVARLQEIGCSALGNIATAGNAEMVVSNKATIKNRLILSNLNAEDTILDLAGNPVNDRVRERAMFALRMIRKSPSPSQ